MELRLVKRFGGIPFAQVPLFSALPPFHNHRDLSIFSIWVDLEPGLPNEGVWIASDPQMGRLDLRFQPFRYNVIKREDFLLIFFTSTLGFNVSMSEADADWPSSLRRLPFPILFCTSIYTVIGGGPPHMRKV